MNHRPTSYRTPPGAPEPPSGLTKASVRFLAAEGWEVPSVTRAQMREIDRIAVEETGPSLLQMMENAGRSLAGLVLETLGMEAPEASVLVLAGPGGNGGGGICAARHLASRVGRVDLFLAEPDRLSDAAGRQVAIFRFADQRIIPGSELRSPGARTPYAVVVDALLGYGLQGVPRKEAARAISWIRETDARVVSLDLPSGVDADTGETPGVFVIADATLTLHLPKPGLRHLGAGRLALADLGIPPGATRRAGVDPPRFGSGFALRLERAPGPV